MHCQAAEGGDYYYDQQVDERQSERDALFDPETLEFIPVELSALLVPEVFNTRGSNADSQEEAGRAEG